MARVSTWSFLGNSLELNLLEGERIMKMWIENDHLFIKTNLDRIFKSTTQPPHFDMVEET